jgi:hypothetical protein
VKNGAALLSVANLIGFLFAGVAKTAGQLLPITLRLG